MSSDQVLRGCTVFVDGRELFIDLVVLDMPDYEVILGMDWLSKYHTTIDCQKDSDISTTRRRGVLIYWYNL